MLAREGIGLQVTGFGNPVAKSLAIEDNNHLATRQQGVMHAGDL